VRADDLGRHATHAGETVLSDEVLPDPLRGQLLIELCTRSRTALDIAFLGSFTPFKPTPRINAPINPHLLTRTSHPSKARLAPPPRHTANAVDMGGPLNLTYLPASM
jgi:hypothetical protein